MYVLVRCQMIVSFTVEVVGETDGPPCQKRVADCVIYRGWRGLYGMCVCAGGGVGAENVVRPGKNCLQSCLVFLIFFFFYRILVRIAFQSWTYRSFVLLSEVPMHWAFAPGMMPQRVDRCWMCPTVVDGRHASCSSIFPYFSLFNVPSLV